MDEKRQIAAVVVELQQQKRQQEIEARREKLIQEIVEATDEKEALVRRALEKVEVQDEVRRGHWVVVVCVGLLFAFCFGAAYYLP